MKNISKILVMLLIFTFSISPTTTFASDNQQSQTIISDNSEELLIYYKNVNIEQFNKQLKDSGWVDESVTSISSMNVADESFFVSDESNPISTYSTSTKYYSNNVLVDGARKGTKVKVTLKANMEIKKVKYQNNLYDVFVKVQNTSASLESSGYTFANNFNVGSNLKNGNTELILTAAIQLQYQQSYAISGSLSAKWISIGGSTGSTYYYRGPVSEVSTSIRLPAYGVIQ